MNDKIINKQYALSKFISPQLFSSLDYFLFLSMYFSLIHGVLVVYIERETSYRSLLPLFHAYLHHDTCLLMNFQK